MRELIDKQETLDALDKRFESLLRRFDYNSYENADEKTKLVCDGLSEAEDVVMGMDTANPRKGKWTVMSGRLICSICGANPPLYMNKKNLELDYRRTNFCPTCGADLRGKNNG